MNREEYTVYLASPVWAGKRRAVLERCGGRCEDCQAHRDIGRIVSPAVEVHHLTYDRVGNEELSDLIGLCERHHEIRHGLNAAENQALAAAARQIAASPEWEPSGEPLPTIAEQFGITAKEVDPSKPGASE